MTQKIRVLQFVSDLSKNGGATHALMNYFEKFYKEVEFDFLFFNDYNNENNSGFDYTEEIRKLDGTVYRIASPLNFYKFKKDWKQFCKSNYGRFDLLENNLPFLGVFFQNAKKELGVKKIITHSHVTQFGDSFYSAIRNELFFDITGKKLGDALFSCTKEAGESIFKKQIKQKKWYIVNNAFDISNFKFDPQDRKKVREKMNWTGKYVIGNVGRLSPQKNHILIIKTFAKFLSMYDSNAILVLVGNGKLKSKIENEINKLDIRDNVVILENRNDVNKLLMGFDTFFFPSNFEGLGLALIEAQIAGLPCLVSNTVPPEADISNYKILNLKEKPEEWALALKELSRCSRYLDGIRLAEKAGFDTKMESKKLERIYRSLLIND